MNETDLSASVERLMNRIDYYLHCELDEDYDHERPDLARVQLEEALRAELARAHAISLLTKSADDRVALDLGVGRS